MSGLKIQERESLEELFGMSSGYVMDFSNRTFGEFFRESVRVEIYSEKYSVNGDSKAKRLRAFIELENDQLVGKALADLLDCWRYKTSEPNAKEKLLLGRADELVEKLLGRVVQPKDSKKEFLGKDFGSLSIKKIPSVGPLESILEARLAEAIKCLQSDAPLAVVFHCGSILEGLLLSVAIANPKEFNQAPNAPTDKSGQVRQFQDWTLAQFIDVSCELGYLKLDVKKFGHALRDFRNFIHPYEQMATKFNPDKHTAEICLQVLKAAIASLGGQR